MKSHCTLTNVDQIKTRNLSRDRINVKYRVSNSVFNSKLKKKKKKKYFGWIDKRFKGY